VQLTVAGPRTAQDIEQTSCRERRPCRLPDRCFNMPAHQGNRLVALKNLIGIDHAVVVVANLDKAAQVWKRLGFTISPRGTHSASLGTGNHTIMLDPDYIELLGVLTDTGHNAPTRDFLQQRGGGIERIALTATDAAAGAEEIRARGLAPLGPIDFERPVALPDGSMSAARFRVFQWPVAEAPGGVRIFACQHKTRHTVWIPELMTHANGAKRLREVLIVTPEPAMAGAHLSRMIDRDAQSEPDGTVTVASGSDRADFVFLTKDWLSRRYPGVSLAGLPERGGAGLVLAASDLAATERALGPSGLRSGAGLCVPPAEATGTLLAFVPLSTTQAATPRHPDPK
jgi:Glyoxalase-like domain